MPWAVFTGQTVPWGLRAASYATVLVMAAIQAMPSALIKGSTAKVMMDFHDFMLDLEIEVGRNVS